MDECFERDMIETFKNDKITEAEIKKIIQSLRKKNKLYLVYPTLIRLREKRKEVGRRKFLEILERNSTADKEKTELIKNDESETIKRSKISTTIDLHFFTSIGASLLSRRLLMDFDARRSYEITFIVGIGLHSVHSPKVRNAFLYAAESLGFNLAKEIRYLKANEGKVILQIDSKSFDEKKPECFYQVRQSSTNVHNMVFIKKRDDYYPYRNTMPLRRK